MDPIRTYIFKKTHRSGGITWVVRWRDLNNGRWISMAAGKTEQEALLVEANVRKSLFQGVDPRPSRKPQHALRFVEVIELFYESPRFRKANVQWQDGIRAQLENVIKPALGQEYFTELKKDRVLKFYLALKEQGLSHSTIRKYHFALSVVGEAFADLDDQHENPIRRIKGFDRIFPRQAPTRSINFLTPDELKKILDFLRSARSDTAYSVVLLLASTGMRRSEALGLKWEDVDLAAGFIHIRKTKTGVGRMIPIEKGTTEALMLFASRGKASKNFVVVNGEGQRPHRDSFIQPLKDAVRQAGIEKRVDLHTLRHSYGSNKIRSGWGLKKVSMLLGHSDITMTSKVYTHLLDGDLKVQDDIRFEREPVVVQTKNPEQMAQFVAEFVQALDRTPIAAIDSAQFADSLSEILTSTVGSLKKPSSESASHAPLMLRRQNQETPGRQASENKKAEIANDSGVISSLKSGGPERGGRSTHLTSRLQTGT